MAISIRRRTILVIALLAFAPLISAQPHAADSIQTKPGIGKVDGSESGKRNAEITEEREGEIRQFVGRNHRELGVLLDHLKENLPRQYQRALRDLDRAESRLAQIRKRDELRHGMELTLWKARSRIQLLAAKIKTNENESLRGELRMALAEEHDLRVQLVKYDRDRLEKRVAKLTEEIDELESSRQAAIGAQFNKLTNSTKQTVSKDKKAAKKLTRPGTVN